MTQIRTWRCPGCSKPIIHISVQGEQIALDPSQRVFSRLVEPDFRTEFWLEDRATKTGPRHIFAEHICTGAP